MFTPLVIAIVRPDCNVDAPPVVIFEFALLQLDPNGEIASRDINNKQHYIELLTH
jgi:hypothetical protein